MRELGYLYAFLICNASNKKMMQRFDVFLLNEEKSPIETLTIQRFSDIIKAFIEQEKK